MTPSSFPRAAKKKPIQPSARSRADSSLGQRSRPHAWEEDARRPMRRTLSGRLARGPAEHRGCSGSEWTSCQRTPHLVNRDCLRELRMGSHTPNDDPLRDSPIPASQGSEIATTW